MHLNADILKNISPLFVQSLHECFYFVCVCVRTVGGRRLS